MGGKNASIVFANCKMEEAVKTHIKSSFINSGQVCLCTSRIYVQKNIYNSFVRKFVKAVR